MTEGLSGGKPIMRDLTQKLTHNTSDAEKGMKA